MRSQVCPVSSGVGEAIRDVCSPLSTFFGEVSSLVWVEVADREVARA